MWTCLTRPAQATTFDRSGDQIFRICYLEIAFRYHRGGGNKGDKWHLAYLELSIAKYQYWINITVIMW